MNKPNYVSAKVAANAVIKHNNKFLLVQQARPKHHHRKWSLPGGKVDIGESFEQALIREIKEETNLVISTAQIITIIHEDPSRTVKHIYLCTIKEKNPAQDIKFDKEEILKADFFDAEEIKKLPLRGQWVYDAISLADNN